MKPYLELADYASVNLETPIFDELPGEPVAKLVALNSRPETLAALAWAGVDYVALGNNHVYDFEDEGLRETLVQLGQSALDFSGAGLTETDALRAHRETLAGTAYDFLSYVGWAAGPPTQIAEAGKGGAAFGSEANLLATTRESLASGAVPVLQYHGGLEYVDGPTLEMETRLKRALDDGAGLVIAHHPHVLQGLELYDGKLIAWSMGNFLFDQYFYATQPSMLLYVWMDEGRFHHAEIVPVYLKGYRPTPAVGWMRAAISRRLARRSAARETVLVPTGGHLAVLADQERAQTFAASALGIGARYETLAPPDLLQCVQDSTKRRYGRDLLARGDFDAYELFDSPDRSWLDLDERVSIVSAPDEPADLEMEIAVPAGGAVTTGMRKFTRVYSPGAPMTMALHASTTAPVRLNIHLQYRGSRQSLSTALEEGEKILVGSYLLDPDAPATIEASFDAPRVSVRSIRILMDAESLDGEPADLRLDDLAFIEWSTPYLPSAAAPEEARWNSHAQCAPSR
jgi:poly-gamma-glutamate capsule biosynthesis protein CapA/YwtB (metallophosphatase superfamily)